MPTHLLVLHGPNVPLRLEQEAGLSLTVLHRALNALAKRGGASLRFSHVHGEEGLLAELWTQRRWLQGILLVPGSVPLSANVEEALALLGVPVERLGVGATARLDQLAYEGALSALLDRIGGGAKAAGATGRAKVAGATGRAKTAGSTEGTAAGKTVGRAPRAASGVGSPGAPETGGVQKTLGRRARSPVASGSGPTKTLGRRSAADRSGKTPTQAPSASAGGRAGIPTRAQTRAQIAARLSGRLSPAELATWAREGWRKVEEAASPDTRLSAVLLTLMTGQRLPEVRLVSLMTELDS